MDSSTPEGMLNTKIHAGSVNGPLRWLLSKGRVSAILNRTTYDSTYIIQTRNMNPVITLTVATPRNHSNPRRLPRPVRGCLDKNPVAIKEVEGGGVREFRDHEGTVETSEVGLSTGFGGLREGGVNVIIIMIPRVLEDGLEVGRERHRVKGGSRDEKGREGEKSEGKDDEGESLIKRVINRKGNPEP